MKHEPFLLEAEPHSPDHSRVRPAPAAGDGLLLSAVELFVSIEKHDRKEISVFQELSENLLSTTPDRDRRRIACLLARHPDTPDNILARLAGDRDPLTAYPVLRHAPAIPEDILIMQAERGPDSLRRAIADRASLSESLVRTLAAQGGPDIIRMLMEREDVSLEGQLLAAVENRGEIMAELGGDLAARGALSADRLMSNFLHLTRELKAEAIACAELASLVEMASQGPGRAPRPVFKAHLLDMLQKSAMTGSASQFATDLAFTLGLPEATAARMLTEDGGETLAIAFKALGFNGARTASLLIRLIGETHTLDEIRRLVQIASTISDGAARLMVRRWVASETLGLPAGTSAPVYQDAEQKKPVQTMAPVRETVPEETGTVADFKKRA
ncbi:DUF2336 domain-containing protein [Roseibium aggregatum]|uniref:DUF2336 domain-containing protein n=1 Tax=Roseibium aggregatum TaxID=187304 RepID=A0A926NXS9_9HYPH|nr:DUF2336 domain-containing protein [Roseibium aggregatum]MBD1545218.1 DUF2336 domain-containing protein [Roseibium aggregatum]